MPSDQMDFQGVLNSQCLAGKRVPWNKGKTKETDERIRHIAERLKEYYRGNPHPQKGKKRQPFTLEHRMKLSQAHLGKKPWYPSKYKPEMPKQLTDFELGWLAGVIDSEGCISLYKKRPKQSYKALVWQSEVRVAMCNEDFIKRLREVTGIGSISIVRKHGNRKNAWEWRLSPNQQRGFLPIIKDSLILKKRQAELLIEALALISQRNISSWEERDRQLERIYCEMKELNKRGKHG